MIKKIAIVTGGFSGEYDISIQSASVISRYLDKDKYDPVLIHIDSEGWYHRMENGEKNPVNMNDFSLTINNTTHRFDAVFISIHGTPGEDGRLQGYFDLIGIPYSTCDMMISALTFHKAYCKEVVSNWGIKVAPSVLLKKPINYKYEDILKKTGMPCFVKPNKNGSSVGITRVNKTEDLPDAIEHAFSDDEEVLVEKFIPGREITCGIVTGEGKQIVLPLCEIVSKKEFFDFQAKYDPAFADEIVPAPIPEGVAKECRETSSFLYGELNCRGIVRFDYIFNDEGLFFLEVNTIPGMTENSIVPKMARSMDISLTRLFGMAIEETFRNS